MQSQVEPSLGTKLFVSRFLKNPRRLGAITPSSRFLGALMVKHLTKESDSPIIELGGGSGSLTRAILKGGINPQRLYVVELDEELASYLKEAFPQVHVIQGDAARLQYILPPEVIGNVRHVVSGLPMINIPEPLHHSILKSAFEIMVPGGSYLQYTYSPRSSINAEAHQLHKRRLGTTFLNFPPASVWEYKKDVM